MAEGSTRERIVAATIEGLEEEGRARLTVRSIAERAGVNVAAVNYHFGSKERLLEAVLTQTRNHGFWESLEELRAAVDAASEAGEEPAVAVREYFRGFISDMVRWPRLTEAQLHGVLSDQRYDGVAVEEMNRFLSALFPLVQPALADGPEAEQRQTLTLLWHTLLAVTIMPRLFVPFLGTEPDAPLPDAYLDRVLDTYFPPDGG